MPFGESLNEFSHGPSFSTLCLFQSAADATDAFQQFAVVQELLIRFGALYNHRRFSVHCENGRLARLLQLADVVLGVTLKIAQRMDVDEVEGHD